MDKLPIDWKSKKAIVFVSDDWCCCMGSRSIEDFVRMTMEPIIRRSLQLNNRGGEGWLWPWLTETLETPEKMQKLFDLLLSFKGGDGRPAIFTPVCVVANPDIEGMQAIGFKKYLDIGIDEGFPKSWRRGDIISKAREGIKLGVWYPQTHGRTHHFSPKKWVRTIREKRDEEALIRLRFGLVGISFTEEDRDAGFVPEPGWFLKLGKRGEELLGWQYDDMTETELDEWIRGELNIFRNAFGYNTHCALSMDAAMKPDLLDLVEKTYSKYGVKIITHYEYLVGRNEPEQLYSLMGKYNPKRDVTYIVHTGSLEPIGKPDSETRSGFTAAYKSIEESWANNVPAVISTHRINYNSFNPDIVHQGYLQLRELLSAIQSEHPEALYLTTAEIGQIYRTGSSTITLGDKVICRNFVRKEIKFKIDLPKGKKVHSIRNLETDSGVKFEISNGSVIFKVDEGNYELEMA